MGILYQRIAVLLFFLFAIPDMAKPQEFKKFSGETGSFLEELTRYMQPNLSTEDDAILRQFIVTWHDDSLFSAEEQKNIVRLSVLLLDKKAKPSPHFSKYLQCLNNFKRKNQTADNFQNWMKGTQFLAGERKTTISLLHHIFEFTQQLIDSSILCKTATVTWKSSKPEYRITAENGISVLFGNISLTCKTRFDSILITGTQGTFYPAENHWKGKDGLVTWERAGFKRDEVFARLTDYEIDMTRSDYKAENVTFINKNYFSNPLEGILTDKVQQNKTPADADFPKFDSYQKDFSISNLYKDINYEGGLSMQGASLVGMGNPEKMATLSIFRKDTLVMIARSGYFAFKADRINSSSTSIVIKLKNDSIFHPGLAFSFIVPNRELTFFKPITLYLKVPIQTRTTMSICHLNSWYGK